MISEAVQYQDGISSTIPFKATAAGYRIVPSHSGHCREPLYILGVRLIAVVK